MVSVDGNDHYRGFLGNVIAPRSIFSNVGKEQARRFGQGRC